LQRWAPALFSRFRARKREAKKERESAKKKERESAKKKEREKSESTERKRKKRDLIWIWNFQKLDPDPNKRMLFFRHDGGLVLLERELIFFQKWCLEISGKLLFHGTEFP
jgi:hypothetical protein